MSTAAEERAMVARLSQMQREKLRPHRDRAHWRTWGPDRFYIERLIGEAFELQEKVNSGDADPEAVWAEAADVANFAAMLADRYESRQRCIFVGCSSIGPHDHSEGPARASLA